MIKHMKKMLGMLLFVMSWVICIPIVVASLLLIILLALAVLSAGLVELTLRTTAQIMRVGPEFDNLMDCARDYFDLAKPVVTP